MKRNLFLLLSAIILFSCFENNDEVITDKDSYKISGVISDAAGQNLYLKRITNKKNEPFKNLDTIKLDETGAYSFTGNNNTIAYYYLTLGEGQNNRNNIIFIMKNKDNITLNSKSSSFPDLYTVEGSKDSKTILDFNNEFAKIRKLNDSVGAIYTAASTQKEKDSIKKEYDPVFVAAVEKQVTSIKKQIDENPTSFANLYIISLGLAGSTFLNPNEDLEYFKKTANSLTKTYPNSENVKSFVAQVKQVEKTKSMPAGIDIGDLAPDIEYPTPDGKILSLSSLQGQYVLLDFWASWCGPCRRENPNLVETYNKFSSKGFTILQVSLDQTDAAWKEAIASDKLSKWHHISDLKYWNSAPAQLYGVRSIPSSYLIGPKGKILGKNLQGAALGAKLQEILGS